VSEPLCLYGGDDLLSVAVAIAHAARRDAFRGAGSSRGVAYSFDVAEAPIVRLVPGHPTHDVAIDLQSVEISVRGGMIDATRTLTLQATGRLALRDGALSLTGLRVATGSRGAVDRIVAGLIDTLIVPRIAEALAAIPVPRLTEPFGGGPSLEVRRAEVIEGPALAVGVGIVGERATGPADVPGGHDLSALSDGEPAGARLIAMASAGAVNALVEALVPPVSYAFDRRRGPGGVKGVVEATAPVIEVGEGRGIARTTVSFVRLKGGIRIPFGGWLWVPLPAPVADVVVSHALSAAGRRAVLTFTGVGDLRTSFAWPSALAPVARLAAGLLDGVLALFRRRIAEAVTAQELVLFELPWAPLGSGSAAQLSFEPGGLGYAGGSLRAVVRIALGATE
jgi:hypothetical protein